MTHDGCCCLSVPPTRDDNNRRDERGEILSNNEESEDELLSEEELSDATEDEENVSYDPFMCQRCERRFHKEKNLQRHKNHGSCWRSKRGLIAQGRMNHSQNAGYICYSCNAVFDSELLLSSHTLLHTHPTEEYRNDCFTLRLTKSSRHRTVRDYVLESSDVIHSPNELFTKNLVIIEQMFEVLQDFLVKALIYINVKYHKIDHKTGAVIEERMIQLPSRAAEMVIDVNTWLVHHATLLEAQIESFNERDSDLEYVGIESGKIKVTLLENHGGRGHFTLPKELLTKKAVINVDTPIQCFKYAVLSILHYNDVNSHSRHRTRVYWEWEDELKFDDIEDVNNINLKDIEKFEKINKIKVNVHVWSNGYQGVRYNRPSISYERVVNLLIVYNDKEPQWHYCGIPKLSRLLYHTERYNPQTKFHYCGRCTQRFKSEERFKMHYEWCVKGKLQMEVMPDNDKFQYLETGNELSPVCVLYCDIECYIEEDTQRHMPAAIACLEKWHSGVSHEKADEMHVWSGENCIVNFLRFVDRKAFLLHNKENKLSRKPMSYTDDDKKVFNDTKNCPTCDKEFTKDAEKFRDHCHITGKFRSALCGKCNSRLRLRRRNLSVIFHNMKSYDGHILLKNGIDQMKNWKIDVIAQTKEKYMSISIKIPVDKTKEDKTVFFNVKVMDSFQFLTSSLSALVNNLDSLPLTQKLKDEYVHVSDEVLKRKGVFPYTYFSSMDKLKETKLPSIDCFKNDLTGEDCRDEEYQHAQQAWQEFACNSFGEYMIAYLKLDVYLLADVFERFRSQALTEDKLDPVHFISLPHMSYQSAFKMTGECIDLLKDIEMYNAFERGIRGGLTMVNYHRARDKTTLAYNRRLLYCDENNLYGLAMSQYLPHSKFRWLNDDELAHFSKEENIIGLDENGDVGYYFIVDLIYPEDIKEATKDFPLAPESGFVTEDMFSHHMKELNAAINNKFKSVRKLLLTQYDRNNYAVHFAILKFYLLMGMRIRRVIRGIAFTSKPFLKTYIDYNSAKRAKADNDFVKAYFKLKNNALYGKTVEDVRKRMKYKIINDENILPKYSASPLCLTVDIITPDLFGVKMFNPKIILNKPIFIGQAVLDYSKLQMYKLYYFTLKRCPIIRHVSLLGGDTDSFFLSLTLDSEIELDDVLLYLRDKFDSSNYPKDHPLFSSANKAKLGCFKDECAGKRIKQIIMLRPKMYSILLEDDSTINRAKGISKSIVAKTKHQLYKDVYKKQISSEVEMTILKSTLHQIHTKTFKKRALSIWEDKRCWLSKNISLPHGHPGTQLPPPKRPRITIPPSGDVCE